MSRVLVCIPAWNEQTTIGGVVREVRAALPDATVVVADDGSRDATRVMAEQAGATVLSLPFNLGVGGALRLGLRYAQRTGHDIVIQVDGDGQHDPADAARLIARLADADLVIGARFAGEGEYRAGSLRRLVMALLAKVLGWMAGTALTDVTSGYRAFGPRAIDLLAEALPAEYLGDTIDALVLTCRAGLVVTQEPVAMRARQGGVPSHSAGKASLYLARALMVLLLTAIRAVSGRPVPRRAPAEIEVER